MSIASPETSNDSRGEPAGNEAGERHPDLVLPHRREAGQAQLPALAPEVALLLQAHHVLEGGRGVGDAEEPGQLPDRRREPVLQDEALDGLEDPALPFRQFFSYSVYHFVHHL